MPDREPPDRTGEFPVVDLQPPSERRIQVVPPSRISETRVVHDGLNEVERKKTFAKVVDLAGRLSHFFADVVHGDWRAGGKIDIPLLDVLEERIFDPDGIQREGATILYDADVERIFIESDDRALQYFVGNDGNGVVQLRLDVPDHSFYLKLLLRKKLDGEFEVFWSTENLLPGDDVDDDKDDADFVDVKCDVFSDRLRGVLGRDEYPIGFGDDVLLMLQLLDKGLLAINHTIADHYGETIFDERDARFY